MENFNKLNLKDGDIITEDKLAIIDSNTDKYNANKTEILNTLDSHTSQLNENAQNIESINTDIKNNKTMNIDISEFEIRKTVKRKFEKYELPSEIDYFEGNIYFDGYNFKTDLDASKYKNKSNNTYYVAIDGDNSKDGLTKENAFKTFFKAYSVAENGDTIIFCNGNYKRDSIGIEYIEKNLNILAETNGKVNLFLAYNQEYTQHETYKNIYYTSRNYVQRVLDIDLFFNEEIIVELTKVNTIEECNSREGSFYFDGTNVYIHCFGEKTPDNLNTVVIYEDKAQIFTNSSSQNVNLYIEGLNLIGGKRQGCLYFKSSETYKNSMISCKNCNFYFGGSLIDGVQHSEVRIIGAKSIFQNCKCLYSETDGFSYSALFTSPPVIPKAIEINCVGGYCGNNLDDGSYNGTTMHNGGRIVRINDIAYNNAGGNIADANEGTVSVNLGCVAFDSSTKNDNLNANFTPYDTTKMYLIACKSFGSKLGININAPGATVNIKNSCYEKITGTGEVNFI